MRRAFSPLYEGLLPPPAFCECRHGFLARRGVAVWGRAISRKKKPRNRTNSLERSLPPQDVFYVVMNGPIQRCPQRPGGGHPGNPLHRNARHLRASGKSTWTTRRTGGGDVTLHKIRSDRRSALGLVGYRRSGRHIKYLSQGYAPNRNYRRPPPNVRCQVRESKPGYEEKFNQIIFRPRSSVPISPSCGECVRQHVFGRPAAWGATRRDG